MTDEERAKSDKEFMAILSRTEMLRNDMKTNKPQTKLIMALFASCVHSPKTLPMMLTLKPELVPILAIVLSTGIEAMYGKKGFTEHMAAFKEEMIKFPGSL